MMYGVKFILNGLVVTRYLLTHHHVSVVIVDIVSAIGKLV